MNLSRNNYLRGVVAVACLWEAGAIAFGGPTWTKGIHYVRRQGVPGTVALAIVWGGLSYHFFLESVKEIALEIGADAKP